MRKHVTGFVECLKMSRLREALISFAHPVNPDFPQIQPNHLIPEHIDLKLR
jgi:hypothetical protein